jgi:NAD(P)-dependent dehydrogenase (short-subunit alcohol dehydrogenase family)
VNEHARNFPAVIVGVTGAIGHAVANRFLESDCRILGISRNPDPSLLRRLQHPKFAFYPIDVTRESQTRAFFADARREHGQIGYLVYAPGLAPDMDTPLADYSLENWHRTVDTYVSGFLICFQEALKSLAPGGHIIALSSATPRFESGNLPPLFIGHYSAAKAALNELCKWGRREAHKRNMLLSRFAPSAVEVPFHLNAPASRRPPAMVPLDYLVNRIVTTALSGKEADEEIVATTDGVTLRYP